MKKRAPLMKKSYGSTIVDIAVNKVGINSLIS
jgi:hypothetical protein